MKPGYTETAHCARAYTNKTRDDENPGIFQKTVENDNFQGVSVQGPGRKFLDPFLKSLCPQE